MERAFKVFSATAFSVAGALLLCALPVQVHRSATSPLGITAGLSTACAETIVNGKAATQDGSCGPATNWVCGLNGINYSNKIYIKP